MAENLDLVQSSVGLFFWHIDSKYFVYLVALSIDKVPKPHQEWLKFSDFIFRFVYEVSFEDGQTLFAGHSDSSNAALAGRGDNGSDSISGIRRIGRRLPGHFDFRRFGLN
jgi:hypothetical protein